MHGYSVCCLYCRVHVHGTNLVEPENKLVYSLRHLRKIESALLFDNILKRSLNDIIYLTWNIYSAKGKANAEKIQTTDIWILLYAVLLTIKQKKAFKKNTYKYKTYYSEFLVFAESWKRMENYSLSPYQIYPIRPSASYWNMCLPTTQIINFGVRWKLWIENQRQWMVSF